MEEKPSRKTLQYGSRSCCILSTRSWSLYHFIMHAKGRQARMQKTANSLQVFQNKNPLYESTHVLIQVGIKIEWLKTCIFPSSFSKTDSLALISGFYNDFEKLMKRYITYHLPERTFPLNIFSRTASFLSSSFERLQKRPSILRVTFKHRLRHLVKYPQLDNGVLSHHRCL